uniref:SAM-dependent methyltransferase n=1 Tax=Schistocephalus solidus TaxID=70667 RepID=A0A183TBV7_SCHSO
LPYQLSMVGDLPTMGSIPESEPEKRIPLLREAAGAQITHFQYGEVVTKYTDAGLLLRLRNRNE